MILIIIIIHGVQKRCCSISNFHSCLHKGTLSGDHEIPSKTNERHLTRPQPESRSPLPSCSPKPRAKTYGSHDALGSPAARLLLNKAGEGGEKRWGGSLREGAERDAVLVSLHPHCEAGGREEAEDVAVEHSVVNPRRACAARVTALALSVCVCVCVCVCPFR